MFGSQTLHPWCHSILIFPLDQAIHPLVRCKNRNSIRLAAPGGGFSTAKSEITLSNGQIQVRKQHTCIVWITGTPSIVWKRAHHSLGSSNRLTCPLSGPRGGDFQRKSLKLRYPTDRYKCTSSAHALHGSLVRHSWCQSVLIIPLDQAIHPLVRCKTLNRIEK